MNSADPHAVGLESSTKDAILLVEDETPLLDVYVAALESEFDLSTATTVRDAEMLLQQKRFKVIMADHLMPGENGLTFLIRAREQFPHTQRILVTGYLKPEILLRSVNEGGVFRCLLKPISMSELQSVMRDAVQAHDASVAAGPGQFS